MRRFSAVILVLSLLLGSSSTLAKSPSEAAQARSFPVPPVQARAAVVIDADTGQVMAAVNPHAHLPIASTTKVMTAVLALELGHLSDRITVPKAAFNYESDATVMGLRPGQVVTLRDLLYGLMLPSGADAANTIAIHYAGSEARWVDLMNRKAAKLGMLDTHYKTAHGLDAPGQYSSAADLARLGLYASAMPDLMQIAGTLSYDWNGHALTNVNHVLFWYPGVDGIKPGFTSAAGICQLLDAQRGGRHVVVAILNTPNLVIDARNLLNFGLRDFSWIQSKLPQYRLPGDSSSLTLSGTDAAGSYTYFVGSGHYVRGRFWQAFLTAGRSAALGFPRTEPLPEGSRLVQYFQNGALAQDAAGHVTRLALGLTPLPATRPPTPTVTPVVTPPERSLPVGGTPTPALPRPASTPVPRRPTSTATPSRGAATATPAGTSVAAADRVFASYLRSHPFIGAPVNAARTVKRYVVQIFRYGALASDGHTVWLLPMGDRLLTVRHFLPGHPGNTYPSGFAPASVLQAIAWLPSH